MNHENKTQHFTSANRFLAFTPNFLKSEALIFLVSFTSIILSR